MTDHTCEPEADGVCLICARGHVTMPDAMVKSRRESEVRALSAEMAAAILICTMPEHEFTDDAWDAGWHDLEVVATKLRAIQGDA